MDCPRNKKGQRMCDLVKLPNHQEWLCTECKSEFIRKEGGAIDAVWLLILILGFLFVTLVLSGCRPNKQSNLLLIRIADIREEMKSIN